MTSATDELRRLLDERGVMHGYVEPDCVWWEGDKGIAYEALEVYVLDEPSGYFAVRDLTPQQAIDATLGRGTCHAVFEVDAMSEDERIGEFVCSECGETFGDGRDQLPRYCPNCGKRCVG